jgi:hypothetical protein
MTNPNGPSGEHDTPRLRGYDAIIDNVTRRQAYERLHPQVRITHVEDPRWLWIATWTGQDDTHRTIRDAELGGLLDQLDNLDL